MRKCNLRVETQWGVRNPSNLSYALLFFFMLVCNLLTPYLVDDFQYLYSFQTGERIRSVLDIFPSLYAHTKLMNGRLITHFLVQLLTLTPTWFFDILNALVFVLVIRLVCRLTEAKGKVEALLALLVFVAIWTFEQMFGQVNLWQDGAINYLWSLLLGLSFLAYVVKAFLAEDATAPKGWAIYLLAFAMGAYSETVSAGVIFMTFLLLLLKTAMERKLPDKKWIFLLVTAFLGYVTIYLAPAQWANKSVGSGGMVDSFKAAVRMYSEYGDLLIAFLVLMVYNISAGTDRKRLLLSGTLLAGSLLANFMMTFASYYPSRSACGACVFLISAVAVLLRPLLDIRRQPLIFSLSLLFLLSGLAKVPGGAKDIYNTYTQFRRNDALIVQAKESGEEDLTLPLVEGSTKYSGIYCLRYLDTQDPTTWPNADMAKFYGVNSMLGEAN